MELTGVTMGRIEFDVATPHSKSESNVKYSEPSFTVTMGGQRYRDSSIWVDCPVCEKAFMGMDSLMSHECQLGRKSFHGDEKPHGE